uniref:Uncharacterized protein n=1 Tax=Panagrolaimus superbus TaxID=310955 RepID=A0A914YBK2_9BILA
MLILLFVSEWVADQQEDCSHVILKQPLSEFVLECFDKLFKDIYYGKDEYFKDSFLMIISSFLNITPSVEKSVQTENESFLDLHSVTNEALTKDEKTINEADYKILQDTLNVKIMEMERINKLNADLIEERENLHQNFLQKNKDLENLVYQKQLEINNVLDKDESLNGFINNLQMELDTCKEALSIFTIENERLKRHNDSIKSNSNKEVALEEDKEAVQQLLDAKTLEINNMNELNVNLTKEKKLLEQELLEAQNKVIDANKLNALKESDTRNIFIEKDRLKEENNDLMKTVSNYSNVEMKLEEHKQKLQQVLDDKLLLIDEMSNGNENLVREKELLEKELMDAKNRLMDANNLIAQKESDNRNIIIENISLNDVIGNLTMERDTCKAELSSSFIENDRLKEENNDLIKVVRNYSSNEVKLEEEKQAIQQALDDKLIEMDEMSKVNEDITKEKKLLEQELLKAKRDLADSNYHIIQKEAEIKNLVDEKQSLDGIINKLQMDHDLCKDELSNGIIENDRLKEENEELTKVVNRKTRNEQKLEEEKEALQQVLDAKLLELDRTKQLLSNVQDELRFVVNKLRSLNLIKSELEAELNAFKMYFDQVTTSLSNTWANVKTLFDDFAAERLHNVSLSNQLETLQQEITVRERSRTPSLHDEGIMAYDSRRESFNGQCLFDGEHISQLMSFDERDEMRLDSGIGSNELTPEATPRDGVEQQQSIAHQSTSSVFSQYLMFTFLLILFYTIYIVTYGALVPSWVYIKLRHERMPPQ